MQLLILLALLVIIGLLAPWMLGLIAAVVVSGGAALVVLCVLVALLLGLATLLLRHVYDPEKQQKRYEKRVKKLTDAANRANKRPE